MPKKGVKRGPYQVRFHTPRYGVKTTSLEGRREYGKMYMREYRKLFKKKVLK